MSGKNQEQEQSNSLAIAKMQATLEALAPKLEEANAEIAKLKSDNEKLVSSLEAVKGLIPSDNPAAEEGCAINTFEIEMKGKGKEVTAVKFAVKEAYKKANIVYIPGVGFQPLDKTIKAYQNKENEQLLAAITQYDEQGYEFAPFEKSK